MREFVQVWRAKVAEADVEPLLAVRPTAIEEAKRLCPELVRAELVDTGDGVWLDVLTWSVADGEKRLMAKADQFDAPTRMRGHPESAEQVGPPARTAPAALWDELQGRFPELLGAG